MQGLRECRNYHSHISTWLKLGFYNVFLWPQYCTFQLWAQNILLPLLSPMQGLLVSVYPSIDASAISKNLGGQEVDRMAGMAAEMPRTVDCWTLYDEPNGFARKGNTEDIVTLHTSWLISVLSAAIAAMVAVATTELQSDPRPSSTPAEALLEAVTWAKVNACQDWDSGSLPYGAIGINCICTILFCWR